MTDEEFCDCVGLEDGLEREICTIIRTVFSEEGRYKKEELLPDVTTNSLYQSSWRAFIGEEMLGGLEFEIYESLGVQIRIDDSEIMRYISGSFFGFFRREGAETFGQWVLNVTKVAAGKVREKKAAAEALSRREKCDDERFLMECGVSSDQEKQTALAVRCAMAGLAKIPVECLYATDRVSYECCWLMLEGGLLLVLWGLFHRLRQEHGLFLSWWNKSVFSRGWAGRDDLCVRDFVHRVNELVERQEGKKKSHLRRILGGGL
jgi:hypothetical protein